MFGRTTVLNVENSFCAPNTSFSAVLDAEKFIRKIHYSCCSLFKIKEEKELVQKTESKVGVYTSSSVQPIPKAPAHASRVSAEQRKKQAEEPLYLVRV
jgi:hypothetical protein